MINLKLHLPFCTPAPWLACFFIVFLGNVPLRAMGSEEDFESRLRSAELAGNRAEVASICREWYASGSYSTGLLNWNYNALMSVEENAWLFTQQESDTYPALMLQYALQVRPDVRVLSFQWMENAAYRASLIDEERLSWIPRNGTLDDFMNVLLKGKNQDGAPAHPLYFGSMTKKELLAADRLYLTGLALKYSFQPFDNLAVLRYNFENRFRTDYLDVDFTRENNPELVARVNLNYIPALLLLHRHYAATGSEEKALRAQKLALRIASANNRLTEVSALFPPDNSGGKIQTAMSAKQLEKPMKRVNDKLFASETELSNAQYEAFLTDLLKNKDFDQLSVCKTAKTDWRALLPERLRTLPDDLVFEHGHPDGPDFPVQNISFEAAQRYCAWITRVYNESSDKKKYKKVLFRLPTEAEWMEAARGGYHESPYPWGGYFVRNSKGCYLGNYLVTEPSDEKPAQTKVSANASDTPNAGNTSADTVKYRLITSNDGGYFPVKVDSYFPNNFGLYAVSGNVAEMTSEPGQTKGGSWMDIPYYGQITSKQTITGPSPAVGFRVFMEVIEE